MPEPMTFGERMRRKRIGFLSRGRSRDVRVIDQGRLSTGERFETRQDEFGNRVRERSASMGVSTGQDVTVRAPQVALESRAVERRQP